MVVFVPNAMKQSTVLNLMLKGTNVILVVAWQFMVRNSTYCLSYRLGHFSTGTMQFTQSPANPETFSRETEAEVEQIV